MVTTSYHHGDLRRVLVAEAGALVAESGARHLSLREVARRAGVSQTAPYRHFEDKEDLLAAVAAEGFGALARHTAERASGGRTARTRLRRGSLAYVEFATANPGLFRLMFSGPRYHRSTRPGPPTGPGLTWWSGPRGPGTWLRAPPDVRPGPCGPSFTGWRTWP